MSDYEDLKAHLLHLQAGNEDLLKTVPIVQKRFKLPNPHLLSPLLEVWFAGTVELFRRAKREGRNPDYVAELGTRIARAPNMENYDEDTSMWATAVCAYVAGFITEHQIPAAPRSRTETDGSYAELKDAVLHLEQVSRDPRHTVWSYWLPFKLPHTNRAGQQMLMTAWKAGAMDLFRRARRIGSDQSYVADIGAWLLQSEPPVGMATANWAAAVWAYCAGLIEEDQIPPAPPPLAKFSRRHAPPLPRIPAGPGDVVRCPGCLLSLEDQRLLEADPRRGMHRACDHFRDEHVGDPDLDCGMPRCPSGSGPYAHTIPPLPDQHSVEEWWVHKIRMAAR